MFKELEKLIELREKLTDIVKTRLKKIDKVDVLLNDLYYKGLYRNLTFDKN
jgi:predicted component of type VI protein secretion system